MHELEQNLIKEIKEKKDIKSFEKLIKLHQKNVRSLVFKFFPNHDELDDVSQDIFIKIYKSIEKFKGDSLFSTWLYRVTVNTCKDKLKSKQRLKNKLVSLEDYHTVNISDDNTSNNSNNIYISERQQFVLDNIKKLPREQQIAIILHDVKDVSYEEISKICNCSIGTVKSRLFNGRKHLKLMIESNIVSKL